MPLAPSWTHLLAAALGASLAFGANILMAEPVKPPIGTAHGANHDDGPRSGEAAREGQANAPDDTRSDGRQTDPQKPTAEAAVAAPSPADLALLEFLLAEFETQHKGGLLRLYYAGRLPELTEFLLRVWLTQGALEQAWRLLAHVDPRLEDLNPEYRVVVARALRDAKSPHAVDAYQLILRRSLENTSLLLELAELDLNAALAALQLHAEAHPGDAAVALELRAHRVRALFAAKQSKAALTELEGLLADGDLPGDLLHHLQEHAPERALSVLRQRLAKTTDPDEALGIRIALLDTMRKAGDPKAARAELDALMLERPDDLNLLSRLGEFDPALAESRWRERVARDPNVANTLGLAEQLSRLGRDEEATALTWDAFVREPGDSSPRYRLLASESLPMAERMLAHLESLPTPPSDLDETLGDLGDLYWKKGQPDRALAMWRRAQTLDPGDGEWSNNLTNVAAGKDPHADAPASDWWRSGSGDW